MEPVLPEKIKTELLYLKTQNSAHKDITINMENIPDELVSLKKDDEVGEEIESNDEC